VLAQYYLQVTGYGPHTPPGQTRDKDGKTVIRFTSEYAPGWDIAYMIEFERIPKAEAPTILSNLHATKLVISTPHERYSEIEIVGMLQGLGYIVHGGCPDPIEQRQGYYVCERGKG